MCIAHVICPAGAPCCAKARCREGHPCHSAQPATLLRVRCRKRRRDENLGPWRRDVIPLPPSESGDSGPETACLTTRSRIGVSFGCNVAVRYVSITVLFPQLTEQCLGFLEVGGIKA